MSTTVKIVFRKSRKSSKIGHLHVRTTANRVSKFRSLGIKLSAKHWDEANQRVLPSLKNEYKNFNSEISKVLRDLNDNQNNITSLDDDSTTILNYWYSYIKTTPKASTEAIRSTAFNHFTKFLGIQGQSELTFSQLAPNHVDMFNKYLSEVGLTPESTKTYMGFLKAVVNKAKNEELVYYKVNPFVNVKFKPFRNKKPKTVSKEFLKDIQDFEFKPNQAFVRDMFLFQIMCGGMRVGDFLMLSWNNVKFHDDEVKLYYRQGKSRTEMVPKIPLVAMKCLHRVLNENYPAEVKLIEEYQEKVSILAERIKDKKEKLNEYDLFVETQDSMIDFDERDYRLPTNSDEAPVDKEATIAYLNLQLKSINKKIFKTYKEIISREQANPQKTIFGFIDASEIHRSGVVTKRSLKIIHRATLKYNYHLKVICKKLNYPPITSHQARHTYAQFLSDNNLNVYFISKAMGHSSIEITANYLRDMDSSSLDKVNEKLQDIF
ncbi:site-specific integrase [Salegentibacter sp. LM13S]|uniref:tyrosine-type recombinase/integrase n=1 Tax=Salegentibacter lacus TaxID=2873599 RepID=UPI001CCDFAD6|nr:tyrosine-type recombinase/integrase [Salegentibacter lacus]MBZ9629169.1 site-specific integrase [Salegentibacter lacus]